MCQRIKATLRCPARKIITDVLKAEEKKVESFRIKTNFEKRKVESSNLSAKCNILLKDLIENELQLGDLKQALARSENMLRFVQESLYPSKIPQIQLNFYKAMWQMLEEKRDRFTVMTCMQFVAEGI